VGGAVKTGRQVAQCHFSCVLGRLGRRLLGDWRKARGWIWVFDGCGMTMAATKLRVVE
jgi:hypothetical protein